MNRQAEETRQNITDAFLDLLQEKPLNAITVKEITDKAGISRVAFYYHYTDIYALFESIQQEAIETISKLLKDSLSKKDSSLFEKELFAYAEKNQVLLSVLVGKGLAPGFILEALEVAKLTHAKSHEHLDTHLSKTDNSVFIDYQFIYMAGGTLFMIFEWITRGQGLSSDKMATLTEIFNHQVGLLTSQK